MLHNARNDLTLEQARYFLSYCSETGVITWIADPPYCNRIGEQAGTDNAGYRRIHVCGRYYPSHRLAWLLHYGHWPAMPIDHVNGNGADNRIENLRLCTPSQNQHNRKMSKNNTTGHPGVTIDRGKFVASIGVNGRRHYLGRFNTLHEAAEAYRQAKAKFHPFSPIARAA